MKQKLLHVGICIPTTGLWEANFGMSLCMVVKDFSARRIKPYTHHKLSIFQSAGSMLPQGRETLLGRAMNPKNDVTHMLWLDTDMTFPGNTLRKLLEHRKDFVAAQGVTKTIPAEPVAVPLNGMRTYSDNSVHGLEEVAHVGLAVALIRTEVCQGLRPPNFEMGWHPPSQHYRGEDVNFCEKLKAKGVRLWIDHDLSRQVGHIGRLTYTHELVGAVKREEVA